MEERGETFGDLSVRLVNFMSPRSHDSAPIQADPVLSMAASGTCE